MFGARDIGGAQQDKLGQQGQLCDNFYRFWEAILLGCVLITFLTSKDFGRYKTDVELHSTTSEIQPNWSYQGGAETHADHTLDYRFETFKIRGPEINLSRSSCAGMRFL
ncbi:hypothetical protein MJD09_11030, partial [bacterium]|nr:hypothetical protein [bacterium]